MTPTPPEEPDRTPPAAPRPDDAAVLIARGDRAVGGEDRPLDDRPFDDRPLDDAPGRAPGAGAAVARAVARFALARAAQALVLVGVISVAVAGLIDLAPGDPARSLLGVRAATPAALAEVRARFRLDEPWPERYLHWVVDLLHGDLGTSLRTGVPVRDVLAAHLPLTLQLTGLAFVLAVALAVPAGVHAGLHAGSFTDRAVSAVAVVGVSAPSYAVGLVLILVVGVELGWLPAYGPGTGGLERWTHLLLPALTLVAGLGAFVLKITRAAVLTEVGRDYVVFARARGLAPRAVRALVLRNALIPVLTSLGLLIAYLVGGTVLVEVTFALPGLGQLLAESVTFKDLPVVQAVTLVTALAIAGSAVLVDLAYLAVDPRVRRRWTAR